MKKILLFILLIPGIVLADTGPKPTINITLKNMKDSAYLIDLMSDFSNKLDEVDKIVDQYAEYKNHPIYTYHEDNYYATALREWLLWGSIKGNSDYKHTFSYFGVPDEFKVIIELADGTIKVSDKIVKTSFNFDIVLDVNDMKVTSKNMFNGDISNINYLKHLGILLLTIIVEVLIAILFQTKKYHIIALTNLGTNICLQLLVILLNLNLIYFILTEVLVVLIEALIYLKTLKINKVKIIIYAIVANLVTALLTFII